MSLDELEIAEETIARPARAHRLFGDFRRRIRIPLRFTNQTSFASLFLKGREEAPFPQLLSGFKGFFPGIEFPGV